LIVFAASSLEILRADTFTYTNAATGTTTQWQAGTNWSPSAPVSASDTTLVLGGGTLLADGTVITANNDVADPFLLNSLVMSYAGGTEGANVPQVVLTGGTLEFVSDAATGATLKLEATGVAVTPVNTIPLLIIQSDVNLTDDLTVSGASNAIIEGVVGGGGDLIKTGSGTLALAGPNDYTGETLISGGTISVRNDTGLGTTDGGTTVNAGGALTLQGGITVTGEALTINGDGAATLGSLRNEFGNNTWAGDITVGTAAVTRVVSTTGLLTITGNILTSPDLTADPATRDQFVLQGDGNGLITGNISGAGRLTKSTTGSGRWTLSGVNTYEGTTLISRGTLQFARRVSLYNADTSLWNGTMIVVSNVSTLALNVGGAEEFTAADVAELQDVDFAAGGAALALNTANATGDFVLDTSLSNANLRLIKEGAGRLTLSVANTYNGTTTVFGGTLRVTHNEALGTTVGSTTVNTGQVLELDGGVAIGDEVLTIRGGGTGNGALISVSGNNSWAGTVNVTSDTITRIGATTGQLTFDGDIVATGTVANGLVFQGNGTIVVNGDISGDGVNVTRSSNGNGLLVYTGTNTYSGTTIISAGALQVGVGGIGSMLGLEVQVNAGTLSGTGTVGAVAKLGSNSAAFLSPGDANGAGAGTLTLSAGLTLNATGGSKIKFNLGDNSDLIVLTGGLFTGNTSGSTQFQITPGAGFGNGVYDLIDWTALAPAAAVGVDLADFTVTGLGAGLVGEFQFDASGQVLQLLVAPEPGRAVLVLAGMMVMLGRRGRRASPARGAV
jgi:autotransporter-associated beta strand protein